MDSSNGLPGHQQYLQCLTKDEEPSSVTDPSRRSANYKPNIWKYDLLQSLTSEYNEERYEVCAQKLKEEVLVTLFVEKMDPLAKLEVIDSIGKLGLSNLFEEEIKEVLDSIVAFRNNHPSIYEDLYAAALCFRLLRQHGYCVSQDMFADFINETGKFVIKTHSNFKATIEFFEASHLALEGENILEAAKVCTIGDLKSSNIDGKLAKEVAQALEHPLHRRVEWYDVRRHIRVHENEGNINSILLKLAKLNFNMVQATHQNDLREISRWWTNLGTRESLSFARDRIVESYLWAVGVAFEPRHRNLRKHLAKVIKLVVIIDDVYDVYGSLQELEQFTSAVDRWDTAGTQKLPKCMKICLQTLYDTTNDIAAEIQEEKGWKSVLPHLKKVWADFCNALLVEAKWYNNGYTPSLQEYLDNGWISCSGPVLSLHTFFSVTNEVAEECIDFLETSQDLVYYSSLIIRLCNDQGTSVAEQERGDAASSIVCFMQEANVSEEVARKHIRSLITNTWKKINSQCITQSPVLQPFVKCVTNMARVAHFIYQNGDGFGVQDSETRDQVLSLLIEPLELN